MVWVRRSGNYVAICSMFCAAATCSAVRDILAAMDEIYSALVTVDYPDAITGGLRRTTDVTRSILEKTRGDLTLAAQQYALDRRLRAFEGLLTQP